MPLLKKNRENTVCDVYVAKTYIKSKHMNTKAGNTHITFWWLMTQPTEVRGQ